MNASFKVFLCSTQSDLVAERESILDAIRKVQLQHKSMEFFGARSNQPIETCLEEVRQSDILVVVVGHRYGTFVPGQNVSYSEAEYQEGHRLGKPCLVYIRSDDVPVLPKHIERDPKGIQALEKFKAVLKERHTIAPFCEAADLAVTVAADLSRTAHALDQTAETKTKSQPSVSVSDELVHLVKQAQAEDVPDSLLRYEFKEVLSRLLTKRGKLKPRVFLTYSHADREIVRIFATALKRKGIEVWFDEAEATFGQSLTEVVSEGIESSKFLVLFMSKNSLASAWVQKEVNTFIARRLRGDSPVVFPVLLEDTEIPGLLRDIRYLDLRDRNMDRAISELISAINAQSEGAVEHLDDTNYNYALEKAIHALRSLLHARESSKTSTRPGTRRVSLEFATKDLVKTVGALCALPTRPDNRLEEFVQTVLKGQAKDLPVIFREFPELRKYLIIPYFDSFDIKH
jgi:hypothetical protein